jgi:hypothetical protein
MWRWREVADARAAAIVAAVSEEALRVIWLALPPEDRARCACVCRAWRDSLADPALWTCMRPTVRRYGEAFDAALRAMAAKAAGRLEVLDLSGLETYGVLPLLLELTTANSGTLRELGVQRLKHVGAMGLLALLRAAPHLQVFRILNDADVDNVAVAMRMLRNEGVYRPLCLGGLALDLKAHVPVNANVDVHALASAVAAHASLRQLRLYGLWMPDVAALDALVDAALTRKLYSLTLDGCFITSAFAPSLARLIGGGYLESIRLAAISTTEAAAPFFDSAAISVLAPALLSNIRLTNVNLSRTGIWADLTAAAALFASLAAHPSLRLLAVYRDEPPTPLQSQLQRRRMERSLQLVPWLLSCSSTTIWTTFV